MGAWSSVGWRGRWAGGRGPSEGAGDRRATTRELIRFAFHTSLATSVQSISGTIVPVLLGRAAGPTAVGIFRISMFPIIVVRTVGGPLRLAMFPEQAKLFADGRVDEIRRSTTGYTLIAFGVGIVGGAIAYVIMPWLIPLLYSSSFEAAVEPARILLIGALFNFALGVAEDASRGDRQARDQKPAGHGPARGGRDRARVHRRPGSCGRGDRGFGGKRGLRCRLADHRARTALA